MTDDQYRNFCRAAIESALPHSIDEHVSGPRSPRRRATTPVALTTTRTSTRWRETLERVDAEHGTEGNRVYYLSTPSSFFPVIVQRMGSGQAQPCRRGLPGS